MTVAVYIIAAIAYWVFAAHWIFGSYFLIAGEESLKFQWEEPEARIWVGAWALSILALVVLFIIGTVAYF